MSQLDEVKRIEDTYDYYKKSGYGNKWNTKNPGNQCISLEQERNLEDFLRKYSIFTRIDRCHVLEIGCGTGRILRFLQTLGASPANLLGIDLLPERIEQARTAHPQIHFECANASALPYADGSFDMVLFFVVFSSVLDEKMALAISSETARVLKPGGLVIWYDFRFNNPGNKSVRGMPKERVLQLFPGFKPDFRSITLMPPLARRLGPLTAVAYPLLSSLPFLRTHYLGVLQKPL